MALKVRGLGFTALLGGLSAIPALAIDMALPSVSLVQADFGASPAEAASAARSARRFTGMLRRWGSARS